MRSCGRARGSVTPPGSWCQRGGGRVNWTDPGGTGTFLTTPEPETGRASASTTNSTARACVVIGAHTSEQGRSLKDSARPAGSPDATTQNIPFGMAATVTGTNWDWRQIGGYLARLRWFFGHLPRRAGRVHPSAGRRHDTLRRHGRRARPQYPAVCRCPYAYAARACQPDLHPGRLPLDDQGRSLPRLTSRRRCARLWRSILFPSSPDPVNPRPAGYSLSRRGLQQRRSGAKPPERRDRATAWVVRGQSP